MPLPRKVLALAAGATLALSAAAISTTTSRAQQPAGGPASGEVLEVTDATFEFIEKSQVAALIEGNLESIELDLGKPVKKDGVIGYLYRKKAELTVRKADVAAKSTGSIEKAEAQVEQAVSVVARNKRMYDRDPHLVPQEDIEKARAEYFMAKAAVKEAKEQQELAKADLELARNALDDCTIKAPFPGVILKKLKNPGESVSAREPIVEMGNLDRLRAFAFIPLDYAYRVSEGMAVEFQPKLSRAGGALPIEQKTFRGVITFVDPQLQPIGEDGVRIYAEFKNPDLDLKPGLKGVLRISLNPAGAPGRAARTSPAEPVVPASTASAPGGIDLPQLPPR